MYRWLAAVGSILRHVIMGRVARRYGAGTRAVQSAAVLVRYSMLDWLASFCSDHWQEAKVSLSCSGEMHEGLLLDTDGNYATSPRAD